MENECNQYDTPHESISLDDGVPLQQKEWVLSFNAAASFDNVYPTISYDIRVWQWIFVIVFVNVQLAD